jgi:hypothetical protein
MKIRWITLLIVVLPALLIACQGDTSIKFTNKAACGPAQITLTNTTSGAVQERTLAEDESWTVKVSADVDYRYQIDYPEPPQDVSCDSREGTITVEDEGKTVNVDLASATPTPIP